MTRYDSQGPLPEHDEPNFADLTRLQQAGVAIAVLVGLGIVVLVLSLIAAGISWAWGTL